MKPEIRRAWNRLWRIADGEETVEQNLREMGFTSDLRDVLLALRAATAGPAIANLHRLDEPKSSAPNPSLPLVGDEGSGGWRAIETAPRDGTRVLTIGNANVAEVARFVPPEDRKPDWPKGENWFFIGWTKEGGCRGGTAHHWQPLPPPPAELSDPLREQIRGDEGGMASRANSADARCDATAVDAQRKSEGGAS